MGRLSSPQLSSTGGGGGSGRADKEVGGCLASKPALWAKQSSQTAGFVRLEEFAVAQTELRQDTTVNTNE